VAPRGFPGRLEEKCPALQPETGFCKGLQIDSRLQNGSN
jgi:hypothetical protein